MRTNVALAEMSGKSIISTAKVSVMTGTQKTFVMNVTYGSNALTGSPNIAIYSFIGATENI